MLVEYQSAVEGSGAVVVHLTGELTLEEVIERAMADPSSEDLPAGVDDITYIQPVGQTRVDATAPAVAIACSAEQGLPIAGPTITVG